MVKGAAFWDAVANGEINKMPRMQVASFQPFRSPIDGKEIVSAQALRNHEKEHDVIQVGHETERYKDKYLAKEKAERESVDGTCEVTDPILLKELTEAIK